MSNTHNLAQSVVIVGTYAATYWTIYYLFTHPDKVRLARMYALKSCENYAENQARRWAHIADAARTSYEHLSTVTV